MNLFSGYSVSHLANGALQVTSGGGLLSSPACWIGLALAAFLLYRAARSKIAGPLWGILLLSLPLIVLGYLLGRGPGVVLNRAAGTATLTQPHLLWPRARTLPLHNLRSAQLRDAGTFAWMALVETDGDETTFPTNEPGADEAAHAINTYLAPAQP